MGVVATPEFALFDCAFLVRGSGNGSTVVLPATKIKFKQTVFSRCTIGFSMHTYIAHSSMLQDISGMQGAQRQSG